MVAAEAGAKTEGWNWADLLRALRPSREDASEERNRDPADRQQRPGRGRAPMATSSTTLCRESAMRNDAQDGGRSSVSSAGHPGELQLTLCCGPPRAYSARRSRMTALTVRPSRAARARATS